MKADGQLAGHDADADAHPPLQARIVALENAEVDLDGHNADPDAHPPLRGRLDALESVAVPDPAGVPDGYVLAVWGGEPVWAPPGEGGPGDAPPVNQAL